MTDNTAKIDPLDEWFRKIGTVLNDEEYEAGIQAMAEHDSLVLYREADRLDRMADSSDRSPYVRAGRDIIAMIRSDAALLL